MFSFFRKKKEAESTERGPLLSVDIHSHLIPGIDDGARDMEESISLLKAMAALGYHRVITTPHIMSDGYRNTPGVILEGLKALRETAEKEGIDMEIEAAAEYYLDDGFYEHLRRGDLLSIGEYLLVETSYLVKPLQFDAMIFDIAAAGYKPMLAHPERYRYIKDLKSEYEMMKEKGIYFQVNLNSLGGHYGRDAKAKADFLNRSGMIDFLGSDIHRLKQAETLKSVQSTESYRTVFENNTILNETL